MIVTPAFAQTAGGAATGSASSIMFIGQFVLLGLIFYFLILRPQQKRAKEHRAKLAAVKKGDEVVTGGGLIGKATKVTDTEVEVEVASGVRVRALKATLTDVMPAGSSRPAND
ncbi:MAG TPA: preprotein translocase subunit YajC [Sphingomonadaceae bacterium]|nr:preprotein translocase subunit YajC [Sphingomonadaceae bacterium]